MNEVIQEASVLDDSTLDHQYWKQKFESLEALTKVPGDNKIDQNERKTNNSTFRFAERTSFKLIEKCKLDNYSLHLLLTGVLSVLTSKYNSLSEIIINTPIYKQKEGEIYVNTILPLKLAVNNELIFSSLIKELKTDLVNSIKHQNHSVKNTWNKCSSLFDEAPWVSEVSILLREIQDKSYLDGIHSNLHFEFYIEDGIIFCALSYNESLYNESTIVELFSHFEKITLEVLKDFNIKLKEISLLNDEQKNEILSSNITSKITKEIKLVHELFYEKVKILSKEIALEFGDQKYTYNQLNIKSNQLARFLIEKGVCANTLVGIMVDRSFEMIVGILGILKAGGAYLPMTPEYPQERISFIIKDSSINLILVKQGNANKKFEDAEIINLENNLIYEKDSSNLKINNSIDDLIYCIYTSGSTGMPKGVLVSHKNIYNVLRIHEDLYPIEEDHKFLLKTNFTFDVSVTELFGWFFGVGSLVILKPGLEKEPNKISDTIEKFGVTHINFVPSMLSIYLDVINDSSLYKLRSLKYLLVAGEEFNSSIVDKLKKLGELKVENLYGPTEASIYATKYSLTGTEKVVSIGKPLENTEIYHFDNNMLIPKNLVGEICIGGDGVTRGYLNRLDLTSERFIDNPYKRNERLYKTGDLMRYFDDGNIDYLGRVDHQVKIRGYRIELGEIETKIREYSAILDAVVLNIKDNNREANYLCAYYTANCKVDANSLRDYLLEMMPMYMLPSYLIQVDQIPLTYSGKVDKKSLPLPETAIQSEIDYVAPKSDIEKSIVNVWQKILNIKQVGLEDNFFHLGGSSTKAILLSNELEKILGVEISVVDLFEYVTINSFIKFLNKRKSDELLEDDNEEENIALIEKAKNNRLKQRSRRTQ